MVGEGDWPRTVKGGFCLALYSSVMFDYFMIRTYSCTTFFFIEKEKRTFSETCEKSVERATMQYIFYFYDICSNLKIKTSVERGKRRTKISLYSYFLVPYTLHTETQTKDSYCFS